MVGEPAEHMVYRCRECFGRVSGADVFCPHCSVTFVGTVPSVGGCVTYVERNVILAMDLRELARIDALWPRKP